MRPSGDKDFRKSLGVVLVHRGVDDSGRNRVYTNAILCVFHRETSRDGRNPAFRDHRDRSWHSGYGMLDHRGGYTDDASAGLLRQHLLNRQLADVDKALQVGGSESSEGCLKFRISAVRPRPASSSGLTRRSRFMKAAPGPPS